MDLFTDSERYKILTNFYEIVDEPKPLKKFPFSKFKLAVSGMYLGDIKEERKNKIREYCGDEYKSKKELYDEIMEAYHEANYPIINNIFFFIRHYNFIWSTRQYIILFS